MRILHSGITSEKLFAMLMLSYIRINLGVSRVVDFGGRTNLAAYMDGELHKVDFYRKTIA